MKEKIYAVIAKMTTIWTNQYKRYWKNEHCSRKGKKSLQTYPINCTQKNFKKK